MEPFEPTGITPQSGETSPPLRLENGKAFPFALIPRFSFSLFGLHLHREVQAGRRIPAFFAVPGQAPETFILTAIIADDAEGMLFAVSCEVEREYASLTPRIPALHLFEREIYERFGLMPVGHPRLNPVRYEKPDGPEVGVMDFFSVDGEEVHEVAVGPIHAGIIECGHFRFQCLGETVMHLEISLGYHHRGVEAMLAGGPDKRTLALMETLCGDSTVAHSFAYCTIVEALGDAPPSPRGQMIRSLALELERLAAHTGDLGALAGDVGFLSTLSHCGALRGDWLNMTAEICGSRFGRGLLVPGGTRFDLNRKLSDTLLRRLDACAAQVNASVQLLWDSPSVMARFSGTGAVSQEEAAALGLVGPPARASGLPRDVRHSHPLSDLPAPPEMFTFPYGDVHARARIRHAEIQASAAYCRRVLEIFPHEENDNSTLAAPPERLAPDHLAVALVEARHGEVCHLALTDDTGRFAMYKVIDPSMHNWEGLALALRGRQISDFPLCNKSFNLSYCGHDL